MQYIDLAIHITIKIYNSGQDFEHWDPQHLAPVDKVNILWGFVLKLNKFEILNIPFN